MRPKEVTSLRTALKYLVRGDNRAMKIRLGCILLASAAPSVMLGLVLARHLL
jgi:hypothetical protein